MAKAFYVWINALTASYAEAIVGRLVRRAWQVGALGNQLVLYNDDKPGSLIAFSLIKAVKEGEPEVTCSTAYSEIQDVMKVLKIKYYCIIVVESTACTWSLGNISMDEVVKEEETQRKGLN